jgi:hypothetical protein
MSERPVGVVTFAQQPVPGAHKGVNLAAKPSVDSSQVSPCYNKP